MFLYKLHTPFCLRNVVSLCAALIISIFHKRELHSRIRLAFIVAREGDQLVLVNLLIGESNQTLVLTSIVPEQSPARKHARGFLEDRVINFVLKVLLIVTIVMIITDARRKEIGRRQLLCIAGDDGLICPEYRTDGILRKNL